MPTPLADALAAAAPARGTEVEADRDALEAELARVVAEASAAWAGVQLDGTEFVFHLARHLPAGVSLRDGLARLATSDLFVACACVRGDPVALRGLDERVLAPVVEAVARRRRAEHVADDVRQILAGQLLVRTDSEPGIARFSGRGSLRAWLRVVATREILRRLGPTTRTDTLSDALMATVSDEANLEGDHVQALSRGEVRAALEDALPRLPERQRTLLRYEVVDGLALERIGVIFGVHRTTASRWVESAHEALLRELRRALEKRIGLSRSEADSLIRAVRSGIEISFARLLAGNDGKA